MRTIFSMFSRLFCCGLESQQVLIVRQLASITFLILWLLGCAAPQAEPVLWYSYQNTVTGESGIATLHPHTKQEQVLFTAPGGSAISFPMLSPGADKIGFVIRNPENNFSLWLMNADGSNPRKISDDFYTARFFWLNNDQLVRMILPKPMLQVNVIDGEVSLFDIPSGEITPLTVDKITLPCPGDGLSVRQLTWVITDLKGSFLALGHPEVRDARLEMIRDREINLSKVMARVGGCASWTADQKKIAFNAGNGRISDFYFTDDGGMTTRRITDFGKDYDEASLRYPALSPDGKWLTFQAELFQQRSHLVPIGTQLGLLKTDGSDSEFLGEWGIYRAPLYWSPDSRSVATIMVPQTGDHPPGEIYLIDVEKKSTTQLTSDGRHKSVFDWR